MTTRAGIRLRPTTEREALYRRVIALRAEGLGYNEIIRRVERESGVRLRKSHIFGWVKGKHRPFGYVRAFDPAPIPELAYVIGVSLGDASMSVGKNWSYMIKLRVKDKDFAEEFAGCLSVLLRRDPPRVRRDERTQVLHTQVSSLLLQKFLRQDLEHLVPTISHCRSCKAAFLKGFFDSEGSMSGRSLTASNENLELLRLVCRLLQSLDIEVTGPYLSTKGGRKVIIKGKYYQQNEDLYYIRVRSKCLRTFRTLVGFSIQRKFAALSLAISSQRNQSHVCAQSKE